MDKEALKRKIVALSVSEAAAFYYNICRKTSMKIIDKESQKEDNTIPSMTVGTISKRVTSAWRWLGVPEEEEQVAAQDPIYCEAIKEVVALIGTPPDWSLWPPELSATAQPEETENEPVEEEQAADAESVTATVGQAVTFPINTAQTEVSTSQETQPARWFQIPPAIAVAFGTLLLLMVICGIITFPSWEQFSQVIQGWSTEPEEPPVAVVDETPTEPPEEEAPAQATQVIASETPVLPPTETVLPSITPTSTPILASPVIPTQTTSPTATETYTPTYTPTSIATAIIETPPLFTDTFDLGLGPEWLNQDNGIWEMANGRLVNRNSPSIIWLGPKDWTDVVVELETYGNYCGGQGGILILLRMQDLSNYVAFKVVGCDDEGIILYQNGQPSRYSTIRGGAVNLRLEAVGNAYRYFINNRLLSEVSISDHPLSGSVGIWMGNLGGSIDNLRISAYPP